MLAFGIAGAGDKTAACTGFFDDKIAPALGTLPHFFILRLFGGHGLDPAIRDRRAVLRAVAQLGFTEVLTLPFASSEELDQLGVAADDPRRALVRLANPLSETHGYLRTTLLPGLFSAVARNTSRSLTDLALFEQGRVFLDGGEPGAPRPSVAHRPSDDELAAILRQSW